MDKFVQTLDKRFINFEVWTNFQRNNSKRYVFKKNSSHPKSQINPI